MGDRCYLEISLHGELKTLKDFLGLSIKLNDENMNVSSNGDEVNDVTLAKAILAHKPDSPLSFYADEVNYADVSKLEEYLHDIGISYAIDHEAGDEYAAACKAWRVGDEYPSESLMLRGDQVIYRAQVEEALKAEDIVVYLNQILDTLDQAAGEGLPPFTIPEDLRRELARVLACEVLGVDPMVEQA
jgi:hypothetical protein